MFTKLIVLALICCFFASVFAGDFPSQLPSFDIPTECSASFGAECKQVGPGQYSFCENLESYVACIIPEQENTAKAAYNQLFDTIEKSVGYKPSDGCKSQLKNLVCAGAFPRCESLESTTLYAKICYSTCHQTFDACLGLIASIACNSLSSFDSSVIAKEGVLECTSAASNVLIGAMALFLALVAHAIALLL